MAQKNGDFTLRQALRLSSWLFITAFFMSFVFNVLRLTGPLFMILIYDRVLASRSVETLVALFALLAAFMLLMGLLDYSRRRLMARFAAQLQERLELQIFDTASKDKIFVAGKKKPATGLNDLDGLRGFFHSQAIIAIFDFAWAPMFLVAVFALHWLLGWVAVAGLALLTILSLAKYSSSKGRLERSNAASAEISGLKDIIHSSNDTVRDQQMIASLKDRWLSARRTSRDRSLELNDLTAWFSIFSRQIRMLTQYSVLAVGAYLTLQGQLSIGAMVAAMFLVVRVLLPVEQFLNQLPAMARAVQNYRSLDKILKSRPRPKYDENIVRLRANLALNNVFVRSQVTKTQILKGVTLNLSPGQLIEIEGKPGSGKTVLANTILGSCPINTGSILCSGANVEHLGSERLSSFFGYVPETVEFINGTIGENITKLEVAPNHKKMFEATRKAGMFNAVKSLPEGFETDMSLSGNQFSKREKNQIALARALYGSPKVLILDEPDSLLRGLLSKDSSNVFSEFRQKGGAIIVLTRRPISKLHDCVRFLLDDCKLKPKNLGQNVTSLEEKKAKFNAANLTKGGKV